MASFRDAFPSKYLKASDLTGPVVVAVDAAGLEDVGTGQRQERKLVAHFVGKSKGLVLNLINSESIAEIAGTDDYNHWAGHSVELYPTKTEFQGKRVSCIRVRRPPEAPRSTTSDVPEEPDAGDEEVAF